MIKSIYPLCLVSALALSACGQAPSFFERKGTANSDDATSGGSVDDHGTGKPNVLGTPDGEGNVTLPGEGANDWTPGGVDDGNTNGDAEGTDTAAANGGGSGGDKIPSMPEIPGAASGDLPALQKCLAKWKNNPFKGTVDNYDRIYASISIGGSGNVINDTERTNAPYLILIDAGVNVGGTPTYNLANPNGYYCMKVNVNVRTTLNINLHCNAHLADDKVNVNVGSTQNSTTSVVGVHVLSNVNVNSVKLEGDTCIR